MNLKLGCKQYKASRRIVRQSQFAQVKSTTGRRARGTMEKLTNQYQGRLLRAYDQWASETQAALKAAERRGLKGEQLVGVLEAQLPKLTEALKNVARRGLREAVIAGTHGLEPSSVALRLITGVVENSERMIDEKLVPAIRERLAQHIMEQESGSIGQYALDPVALVGAFDAVRRWPGDMAGDFWAALHIGAGLIRTEEDEKREAAGLKPQRVRWVLDLAAQHCEPSPGFYGCVELAGIYDSWDDMPTIPAGQVTCRGNCRCHIDVEEKPGQWERIA